eukprot:m.361197 g.361197  ORF g.361197 m.361197 type:complete len:117 (-) comp19956_c0_seq17:328-678(-)
MEHMPSLGTLLSCLTACKDLFKLVSKVEASSEVKSNQLRLKQNHVQLTVDKCLLLVVSQSALMLQTEATQGVCGCVGLMAPVFCMPCVAGGTRIGTVKTPKMVRTFVVLVVVGQLR